jgi:ubiquinone/menaquinone biosynthesis C-methylase UbiE
MMDSFERHWEKNGSDEIPNSKKKEAEEFLAPLFDYQKMNESICILDAGCGDGVHIDVIRRRGKIAENSLIVGLDISLNALNLSRRRHNKYAWIQGDIGRLPFADNQFDIVISFGVLAYTQNPSLSFSELCRVTRKSGLIGIWVYPQIGGLGGFFLRLVRYACRVFGYRFSRLMANCIVPFLGMLPTRSNLNLANANWQQCREVVMVTIAPHQLYFPKLAQVESWFKQNDIRMTNCDESTPITLWGQKC